MRSRLLVAVAAGLVAVIPSLAHAANAAPDQNANWEALQKMYPPRALKAHEEGAVGFFVSLDSSGAVTKCMVTHSSGHLLLDQETCNIITLHAQFGHEKNVSPSQITTHEGVIIWKLPASAGVVATPPINPALMPEKVICKRTVRIGTLSGFERACMTQREWAKQSDESKEVWEDLQGKKGSTHGD
jgi:protein TonB